MFSNAGFRKTVTMQNKKWFGILGNSACDLARELLMERNRRVLITIKVGKGGRWGVTTKHFVERIHKTEEGTKGG
jgi:hypothetical protein